MKKLNSIAELKAAVKEYKPVLDLRENHTSEVNISDLEDEFDDDIISEEEKDEVYEDNDYYDDIDDMDDDKPDDDLKDLVIVDENYDESEL